MPDNHIQYCIEGNTKNCPQRYEQWEGVCNAKINAEVENDPKDGAGANKAPRDVHQDLHMQQVEEEQYRPESQCTEEPDHGEEERHLVEGSITDPPFQQHL